MTKTLTRKHALKFTLPSKAKQEFRDECNINTIMKKYEKYGVIDHVNKYQGTYGNFIGYEDYHANLIKIQEAQDAFLTIPANIRRQFNNDPAEFLEFVQNPQNANKLTEMGLAKPKPADHSKDQAGDPPAKPKKPPQTAETNNSEEN